MIYALKNRTTDLVYYGSTKTPINHRFNRHKYLARQYEKEATTTKGSAYEVIRCPTAYIELVEEVNEENMLIRERWWIENNPCVNFAIPTHTRKEYRDDPENRQKAKEYNKVWVEQNKEELKAYKREWARAKRSRNNLRPVDTSIQGV